VVCSLLYINSSNAQKIEKYESFNVKISGKGAPIFFIPGILCSADVWEESIKHYEKNYTCYAFTLAGFAEASPLKQGTEIMPKIKSDLIAYIKSHSNNNAILVGHSMGGFYGLMIASSEPSLLKKLVVVDALPFLMAAQDSTRTEEQIKGMLVGAENTYLNTEESVLKNQQLAILRTMITNETQIEKACTWSMRSDRYTMGKSFAEMMGTDLRDDVKNINTNTLVMVAWDKPIAAFPDYTKEASYKVYAQQYKNLKGVQLKQTDGAKHFIMYDQPEWFIKTLDDFIN
jgi:N-formylmaleamate deformylase